MLTVDRASEELASSTLFADLTALTDDWRQRESKTDIFFVLSITLSASTECDSSDSVLTALDLDINNRI